MRCTFFTSVKTDKSLEMSAAHDERKLWAAGFLLSSRGMCVLHLPLLSHRVCNGLVKHAFS